MSDQHRVVVVTGAAGGIGLGIARAYGEAGDAVVLVDIDDSRLKEAHGALVDFGIDAHLRKTDVRDLGELSELAAWVMERFGRVDVVCLNAGGPVPRISSDVTEADWERDLALNLFSVVHGVSVFLPVMEAQGHGHINATTSMSGLVPFPPVVTYNVAKAGAIAYMETVARELAGRQSAVTVSVLCPGEVATAGVRHAMDRARSEGHQPTADESAVADAAQASLLRGGMSPDDVGHALVDGIEAGRFWIFTHPDWVEGPLQRRHDAMTSDGALAEI